MLGDVPEVRAMGEVTTTPWQVSRRSHAAMHDARLRAPSMGGISGVACVWREQGRSGRSGQARSGQLVEACNVQSTLMFELLLLYEGIAPRRKPRKYAEPTWLIIIIFAINMRFSRY